MALAHLTTGELREVIDATQTLADIHKRAGLGVDGETYAKITTLHADAVALQEDHDAAERRSRIAEVSRRVQVAQ
jgi:hypothetical protein